VQARNLLLFGTCLLFGAALAQTDKPNFSGTWHLDKSKSGLSPDVGSMTWTIQQDDSTVQVVQEGTVDGKPFKAEFKCSVLGKECPMNDRDHKAKASVYFNGPVLVVMKTQGRKDSEATKERLKLLPDGNTMEVDVMYIMPQKDGEKLVFTKAQ
jgi:hypothetical protein